MLIFEYHYGNEADLYSFYRIPKILIKYDYFMDLSDSAKVLFGLMLDRLSLSLKNEWKDSNNRVFIFYTLEDIQDDLHCAHGKATKLLSELENIGLIERVKQGQGKPTRIYVKKYILPNQSSEQQTENQDCFEYHYGNEADLYSFYRIPKILIKHDYFTGLSDGARVLFGLMLDRLSLSLKNEWKDGKNRVFIFYTLEDIQDGLRCAHGKAIKLLSELEKIGLIEKVKQGQGRPTKIYVKKFILPNQSLEQQSEKQGCKEEMQTTDIEKSRTPKAGSQDLRKSEVKNSENKKSRPPKIGSQDLRQEEIQTSEIEKSRPPKTGSADFSKSDSNYTNKNNNNLNYNKISQSSPSAEQKTDGQDKDRTDDITQKIEAYTELIKDNISYDDFVITRKFDLKLINEFINIMVDVILTEGKYVRIEGENKPRELVKHVFLKLEYGDMDHAIDQFLGVTSRINKKKQYIISTLYNCKLEVDSHYSNLVKHDMYS